jgi:hypothetical protein
LLNTNPFTRNRSGSPHSSNKELAILVPADCFFGISDELEKGFGFSLARQNYCFERPPALSLGVAAIELNHRRALRNFTQFCGFLVENRPSLCGEYTSSLPILARPGIEIQTA